MGSYGPEATTIRALNPGTYTFYVHAYSNRTPSSTTALASSSATVTALHLIPWHCASLTLIRHEAANDAAGRNSLSSALGATRSDRVTNSCAHSDHPDP